LVQKGNNVAHRQSPIYFFNISFQTHVALITLEQSGDFLTPLLYT